MLKADKIIAILFYRRKDEVSTGLNLALAYWTEKKKKEEKTKLSYYSFSERLQKKLCVRKCSVALRASRTKASLEKGRDICTLCKTALR